MYETRLGSFNLDGKIEKDMAKFIGSVHNIFNSAFIGPLPYPITSTFFRKYQKMNDAGWSTVFEVGKIFAITDRVKVLFSLYFEQKKCLKESP